MGRPKTQKEAFRDLSHKFHGKTSGKMKQEKRAKRIDEVFKSLTVYFLVQPCQIFTLSSWPILPIIGPHFLRLLDIFLI